MPDMRHELADLTAYVRDDHDVVVQGPWGSGVQLLLDRATEALARLGYTPFRLAATEDLQQTQFGALRFAFGSVFVGTVDITSIVDRFCTAVSEHERPVLVIDNVDFLDPYSVEALRQVTQRTNRLVVSGVSVPGATIADGVHRWPLGTVRLSRMSYAQVEDLLASRTQRKISSRLTRRIYLDTAGALELVPAVFDSLVRCGGIELRNDEWQLNQPEVWTEALIGVFGSALSKVNSSGRELLQQIAQRGGVTTMTPSESVSDELVRLERMGFLSTSATEGAVELKIVPRLLTRYFQSLRQPIVEEASDTSFLAWRMPVAVDSNLVTSLDESAERGVEEARMDHVRTGDLASAVRYMRALWASSGKEEEVQALIDRFDSIEVPEGYDEASYIVVRAQWYAQWMQRTDIAERQLSLAIEGLSQFQDEGLSVELEVYRLAIRTQFASIPPNVVVVIRDLAARSAGHPRADLLLEILVYVLSVAGQPDLAFAMMPPDIDKFRHGRELRILSYGMSKILVGDIGDAITAARDLFETSVSELDRDGIYASTYIAALCYLFIGRWPDAHRLIKDVNAIGNPSLLMYPVQKALRGLQAFFSAMEGRSNAALWAVSDAVQDRRPSPLIGSQGSLLDLVKIGLEGDVDHLSDVLASSAMAAEGCGYLFAATYTSVLNACQDLTEEAVTSLGRLADRVGSSALWSFTELLQALLAGDESSARRLIGRAPANSFSFAAYWALNRFAGRVKGKSTGGPWHQMAESLRERLRLEVSVPMPVASSQSTALSAREKEVAALAGLLTNSQIADRLGVSKRTIDHHISNAMRKAGVSDRYALAAAVSEALQRRA